MTHPKSVVVLVAMLFAEALARLSRKALEVHALLLPVSIKASPQRRPYRNARR